MSLVPENISTAQLLHKVIVKLQYCVIKAQKKWDLPAEDWFEIGSYLPIDCKGLQSVSRMDSILKENQIELSKQRRIMLDALMFRIQKAVNFYQNHIQIFLLFQTQKWSENEMTTFIDWDQYDEFLTQVKEVPGIFDLSSISIYI